jgi:glycerol kinase
MSGTESEPEITNKQIFELVQSLQQNYQKVEQRINELEKRAPPSPGGFELVHSRDWHGTDVIDTEADFIGAIDQGTTSSRFLIFSKNGEPVATHQIEFKQIYPNSGYVDRLIPLAIC